MKICIDISQSVYQRGVGRYTRELVGHLLKIDKQNDYILFGSSLRQQKTLKDYFYSISNRQLAISKFYPIPPTLLEILFNRLHFSIDPFIGKVDVFHSSDWTQPKTQAKKVTTIHDLAPLKFPDQHHPKIFRVQKRRLELVKREVNKIIAVSQNTKKDIIEILQIPPEKIVVIYEAASESFKPKPREEIEAMKNKLGIGRDYILTVATLGARKNLAKLFAAFDLIKKNFDLILVIVGIAEINNGEDVIETGFLEDLDLAVLYSGAKAFVYPSIYEGFGLPVLEAMACGVPVVCSNTSSLPEVGGNAVVYCDPNSTQSLVEGVKKILSSTEFAQELSQRSLTQSKKFSWEKCAKETLKLYQILAKS